MVRWYNFNMVGEKVLSKGAEMKIFILEYYPYNKADGVEKIIGPFSTRDEAKEWRKQARRLGAHPDSEWQIIESSQADERLDDFKKERELNEE